MNDPNKSSGDDQNAVPSKDRIWPALAQNTRGSGDAADLDALNNSGWAERRIRTILRGAVRQFQECRFLVAAFGAGLRTPTKVVCSEGVDEALVEFLQQSNWRAELLSANGASVSGLIVPGGFHAFVASPEGHSDALLEQDRALVFTMPGPLTSVVAAWKPLEYGPFRELDIAPLRETAQIVSTIIRLGVEFAAAQMAGLAACLERLDLGYLVVDQSLRLVYANAAAERLLQKGDYMHRTNGVLQLADQIADTRLQQVMLYLAGKPKRAEDSEGVVAIRAANDARLARCVMTIQRDTEDALLGPPLFALTIMATRDATDVDSAQLRRRGFTPAETELVTDLMKGLTVTQHANERGIAVATARAHLKRAMMRIGVHRQTDLIRYVVGLS